MDRYANSLLCLLEDLLGKIIGLINKTIGQWFGFDLDVPDLGCEE